MNVIYVSKSFENDDDLLNHSGKKTGREFNTH